MFIRILKGFAQRKCNVDLRHETQICAGLQVLHLRHFIVGKAIGFEVGQRIPSVAIMRRGGERGVIGSHRVIRPPIGLQGMPTRCQRGGIIRQRFEHVLKSLERRLILPGLHALYREQGEKNRAIWIFRQQALRLR